MSSLSDRVRGIIAPSVARTPQLTSGEPQLPIPDPQSPTLDPRSPIPDPRSFASLGGIWRDGAFVIERRWERTARHGRETVGDAADRLAAAADHAPLFSRASAAAPFLFFDLETTGLSGGAGTHAFLVGCGWFDDCGGFVTRQFLMARFADERPLLATVGAELARAGVLVSFNGKSFDAPVLETRYLFHRLEWNRDGLPHIDVLHAARRFWGGADSSCTLQTLERRVVGCRPRVGDVPGFEIPARFFQFVRTGNVRPLAQVLEHNRLDLLTLGVLTSRLLHLARGGADATDDASEALGLGRTYVRAGLEERARASFMRAVELSRAPAAAFDPVRIEAVRALALSCRRARRFEEAATWWQTLVDTRGCPASIAREAAEALAIHHEHRIRDIGMAKTFALKTLEIETRPGWRRSVEYRLARLARKEQERGQVRSLKYEV